MSQLDFRWSIFIINQDTFSGITQNQAESWRTHLRDFKAGQLPHLSPCEAVDRVGADFEGQLSAI